MEGGAWGTEGGVFKMYRMCMDCGSEGAFMGGVQGDSWGRKWEECRVQCIQGSGRGSEGMGCILLGVCTRVKGGPGKDVGLGEVFFNIPRGNMGDIFPRNKNTNCISILYYNS